MVRLTETQLAWLKMFGPDTYGLNLPPTRERRSLEMRGLIEWVPPKFGTALWAITDKGREALAAVTASEGTK